MEILPEILEFAYLHVIVICNLIVFVCLCVNLWFLFPGIHGGRVNHWAALQIDGQGKIKLSNTNCPTNKNPYPGNWRCIFSIEEVFLSMIKDVFLQMTGETLFTMIEDMILQIIGDIFLQNLGCIISKLGISLCRIEDKFCRSAGIYFCRI